MTEPNICLIAGRDCNRSQIERSRGLPICWELIMNDSDYGRSPAQPLSRATIGATADG